MENLEWRHDLERQEAILVLNEICRHYEELQEEFPGEWPAFDELGL
jgi:hypothetical protein